MKKIKGFTLLELLSVISITTILSTVAVPSLSRFITKQTLDSQIYSIRRLLFKTRELSIHSGHNMSFCGINELGVCNKNNIKGFIVFFDQNKNNSFDSEDTLHTQLDLNTHRTIKLIASKAKSITFNRDGFAKQFGRIVICPNQENAYPMRRVSLNRTGRVYIAPASEAFKKDCQQE